MCSMPRNPQRKPKPSASELIGWNVSAASLSCELAQAVAHLRELRARAAVEIAEDHLLRRTVARQGLRGGAIGQRVPCPPRAPTPPCECSPRRIPPRRAESDFTSSGAACAGPSR